jgi:hypothetical protein
LKEHNQLVDYVNENSVEYKTELSASPVIAKVKYSKIKYQVIKLDGLVNLLESNL